MLAPRLATGFISLVLVLSLVGLALHPGHGLALNAYFDAWLWRIVRFSIEQALLSSIASIALAIPFALILSAQPFKGEWAIKSILNLFFIMPVLTVILGVVAAFSSIMNVFSLSGIVLAHVLLNLPFATRLLWLRLGAVSNTTLQNSTVLGFSYIHRLRWIYTPLLIQAMLPVFMLIFLLCFSSFAVVLTLGGGPANTNLEVAIYQALKFDFDPTGAAVYAAIHGSIALVSILALGKRTSFGFEAGRQKQWIKRYPSALQSIALVILLGFLALPVGALVLRALTAPWVWPARLFDALTTSMLIGLGSAVLAIGLACARALNPNNSRRARVLDFGLLVSPLMVISTGLFLVALKLGIAFKITFWLIIILNALMAMPLILSPLQARIKSQRQRYEALSHTLNFREKDQWCWIYWPAIRPLLPWLFGLSMVLSLGDLGVAALIGSAQFVTLPILIFQAMGSYQLTLAYQLTLLLLMLCTVILALAEYLSDRRARFAER